YLHPSPGPRCRHRPPRDRRSSSRGGGRCHGRRDIPAPRTSEGTPGMDDLEEIIQEFLIESHENLDQLDRDLVALEQEPGSRELLASIFRTIHTIKGTSGFLAFSKLESVTHVGENLLARLRDGKMQLTAATADVLPVAAAAAVPSSVPAAAPAPAPAPAAPPAVAAEEPVAGETRRTVADSSIRVDVDLLDALMRLVGELVLTRNQIVRQASES